MSQVLVTESSLEDIGDAIRTMNLTSNTYLPSEMADAILGIEQDIEGGVGDGVTIRNNDNSTLTVMYDADSIILGESGLEVSESWAQGQVEAYASDTAPQMDGTAAAGTSDEYARADHVHPTDTSLAPLDSPALTGTPTAPTATTGTDTTQVATTAFVQQEIDANAYTHPDSGVTAGSYGDTTNQTPAFGGTFKVTGETVDAQGHVTTISEHTVTIPATEATTGAAGLMSAADKTKLDGVEDGANAYELPTMSASNKGGAKVGVGLAVSDDALGAMAYLTTETSGGSTLLTLVYDLVEE